MGSCSSAEVKVKPAAVAAPPPKWVREAPARQEVESPPTPDSPGPAAPEARRRLSMSHSHLESHRPPPLRIPPDREEEEGGGVAAWRDSVAGATEQQPRREGGGGWRGSTSGDDSRADRQQRAEVMSPAAAGSASLRAPNSSDGWGRVTLQSSASAPLCVGECIDRSRWVADSLAECCRRCDRRFTVLRRRHHCRSCGEVFCQDCSAHSLRLRRPNSTTGFERVCDDCMVQLTAAVVRGAPEPDAPPSPTPVSREGGSESSRPARNGHTVRFQSDLASQPPSRAPLQTPHRASIGGAAVVHVRMPGREPFPVEYDADETVGALKNRIYRVTGIAPARQLITRWGRECPDGTTLMDNDIREGDRVQMQPRDNVPDGPVGMWEMADGTKYSIVGERSASGREAFVFKMGQLIGKLRKSPDRTAPDGFAAHWVCDLSGGTLWLRLEGDEMLSLYQDRRDRVAGGMTTGRAARTSSTSAGTAAVAYEMAGTLQYVAEKNHFDVMGMLMEERRRQAQLEADLPLLLAVPPTA
eukprot:TRINITY_DN6311_c7_g1_i1.p1 TRINITY_DN6311_c7_g1~~TRINITY_DN6311_c7_g1_i1.p1  ORF type:complete len:527 (+),score=153.84 TRINITY_DN6311_c7_g1_i1:159-1739(+)